MVADKAGRRAFFLAQNFRHRPEGNFQELTDRGRQAWAQNDATKRQLKNLASFKAAYYSNGHQWGWD